MNCPVNLICPCIDYSKEGLCDYPYKIGYNYKECHQITEANMKCECYAVATDPERKRMWEKIFYGGKVPVTSRVPVGIGILARHEAEYYLVDFSRVSSVEKETLIYELAEKFYLSPGEIRLDIEEKGCPIKASNLIIVWCKHHTLAAR